MSINVDTKWSGARPSLPLKVLYAERSGNGKLLVSLMGQSMKLSIRLIRYLLWTAANCSFTEGMGFKVRPIGDSNPHFQW
jgi:hypothetical protein